MSFCRRTAGYCCATVGFIRHLPTTLVKAFRATLEEVVEAALLLHVVDAAAPQAAEHVSHVLRVLAEIGAGQTPQLMVLNKLDLASDIQPDSATITQRLLTDPAGQATSPRSVAMSAKTGQGFANLLAAIDSLLPLDPVTVTRFRIPHSDGGAVHLLHEYARVLDTNYGEEYSEVVAETPESIRRRLARSAW